MVCDLTKVVQGFVDKRAIVFQSLSYSFLKWAAVTKFSWIV